LQNELRIRAEIRAALEPVVSPAPWLTANIRTALGARVTPRRVRPWRVPPAAWPTTRAAVAILLLIALAVALFVGARALNPARFTPSGQVDPTTKHYRSVVDADFAPVEKLVLYDMPRTCTATTAATCDEQLGKLKIAVQNFQDDLAGTTVPPALAGYHVDLSKALGKMNSVVDAMGAGLDRRDYAAYAAGLGQLFDIKLDTLYPNVVAVDCWPKAAVHGLDSAGYDTIVCGSKTAAQDYMAKVNGDWVRLRGSLSGSHAVCGTFGPSCREQTNEALALVDQFQRDLDKDLVPVQFATADTELRKGLDSLMSALSDRIAAIDAGDRTRWDKANVAADQAVFNLIAHAVGELSCWPKGVGIGDDSSTTAWPCAAS